MENRKWTEGPVQKWTEGVGPKIDREVGPKTAGGVGLKTGYIIIHARCSIILVILKHKERVSIVISNQQNYQCINWRGLLFYQDTFFLCCIDEIFSRKWEILRGLEFSGAAAPRSAV